VLNQFEEQGIGYCISANISTAASSFPPPAPAAIAGLANLTASPGTAIQFHAFILDGGFPSDISFTEIEIEGHALQGTHVEMPAFEEVPSGSLLQGLVYADSAQFGSIVLPFPIRFVNQPLLTGLCPFNLRVFVEQRIAVQGSGFHSSNDGLLRCIVDDAYEFEAIFVREGTVFCILFWRPSEGQLSINVKVTNDGTVPKEQQSQNLNLVGFCDIEKPGSIITEEGCICPPGTEDSGNGRPCVLCQDGFYQPEAGQSFCIHCGNYKNTNGEVGSVSVDRCVCEKMYYPDEANECQMCIDG